MHIHTGKQINIKSKKGIKNKQKISAEVLQIPIETLALEYPFSDNVGRRVTNLRMDFIANRKLFQNISEETLVNLPQINPFSDSD